MNQVTGSVNNDASGESLASVLGNALATFDETLVILRKNDLSVAWFSPAAQRLLPDLCTDAYAEHALNTGVDDNHSSKAQLVQLFGDGLYADLQQLAHKAVITDFTVNLSTAHSSESVVYSGSAACIDPCLIALRLQEKSGQYLQLQQYMEEREKLFTTSRTISVSEMATTLAHELNQPIGTVSNILKGVKARLLRAEYASDEIINALDRADDQTQFAARIISRIRDFTQSRQPSRIDCNVKTLLVESLDLLDWVLAKGEVIAKVEDPGTNVMINGDPTMLQQVFTNLIRNAVDSMRENESTQRRLIVAVMLKDGDVQISIADTGHGLSKTAENNLFVPFVTQKTQGMGVGLNICRSFVELHQGRLWLAQNDDGGCTAFVVLPQVHAAAPEQG